VAYNPNTNVLRARTGGSNGYQSWDRGVVTNGKDWARGGTASGPRGTAGWVQTSAGGAAVGKTGPNGGGVLKTGNGDVYAGKDGNVYRRDNGQWQNNQSGQWKPAEKANSNWSTSGTQRQLNNDSQSRVRGDQLQARTQQTRPATPARQTGGGARNGGGRGSK
jgi:hypothetical protein